MKDLFQPPVVRQYISGGRLYREKEERVPDRFELFLDLVSGSHDSESLSVHIINPCNWPDSRGNRSSARRIRFRVDFERHHRQGRSDFL